MEQLGAARAILLVGNDPTEQNPLAAWQMRTAVRLNSARLYVIHAQAIKLARKAKVFAQVAAGTEPAVARWLAGGRADLDAETVAALAALKAALEKESDVAIVFGAELAGRAVADLVTFGSKLPGTTRYMALGDYANSRGASDMGLLPGFLPGYARVDDPTEAARFGKLWGAALPAKPGLDARAMIEAAASGKLKALYVVGANPVKTFGVAPEKLRSLELLVVHELFLTETAAQAHVVLPAASAYEKDGTVTSTSGEVQTLRRALETMGSRTDFDLLRILSHQLARAGAGPAAHFRTPQAVFEEIHGSVRGYNIPLANLLTGGAEPSAPQFTQNGHAPYDVPVGAIFSSRDTLFTSGSLSRYCSMVALVPEAMQD
jgi:NADH-quinone oxidoreductase subunit G